MEDKKFNEELITAIPEAKERYLKEVEMWDGEEPGSTIIVESCVMPIVYEALDGDISKKLIVERFLDWMEEIISKGDKEEKNIILIAVFEKMMQENKINQIKEYFKEKTKEYFAYAEQILTNIKT